MLHCSLRMAEPGPQRGYRATDCQIRCSDAQHGAVWWQEAYQEPAGDAKAHADKHREDDGDRSPARAEQ